MELCFFFFFSPFFFVGLVGGQGGSWGGNHDYGLVIYMVSFLQQRVRRMLCFAHAEWRN